MLTEVQTQTSSIAAGLFFAYYPSNFDKNHKNFDKDTFQKESNRPITRYIEKGSKVLSTLEPFSIYTLS